jgi:hypothetical protein
MSPVPVGTSPEPERRTVAVRLGVLLDRIEAVGIQPVVNPARSPWTAPATRRSPLLWFVGAFVATALLVLFWFFVADGSGGFIYAGF